MYEKKEIKQMIREEKEIYLNHANLKNRIKMCYTREPIYMIWKFVYWLRKSELYSGKRNLFEKIALMYCRKKKNTYGMKMNIEIHENCFKKGMLLYHGNIVVNSNAQIGKNARLHGGNCIGNNGKDVTAPVIGDDVEIGYGAGIYGKVNVKNGCKIGANAVVVKSTLRESTILVGVPAIERVKVDEG